MRECGATRANGGFAGFCGRYADSKTWNDLPPDCELESLITSAVQA